MKEIPFSVPVSGVIQIDGNKITVIVNRASTTVLLESAGEQVTRTHFSPGENMFDAVLESAKEFLRRRRYNRFTPTELFDVAKEMYPGLNRRSFLTRVTASTPNHPSYEHHLARRDYFSRIAEGIFSLENKYHPNEIISGSLQAVESRK